MPTAAPKSSPCTTGYHPACRPPTTRSAGGCHSGNSRRSSRRAGSLPARTPLPPARSSARTLPLFNTGSREKVRTVSDRSNLARPSRLTARRGTREQRRRSPRRDHPRRGVRVFSPSVKRLSVSVTRPPASLSSVSAGSGSGVSVRARARARHDSPLRAPESALAIPHVRETTREKRSPDHVAAIGAPVNWCGPTRDGVA